MNMQCLQCKGRNLCGRPFCPIQSKISAQKKVNINAKQDFFGAAPNVFVGKYGYPNVNVGILSVEEYAGHDDPATWSREGHGIQKVIDLRTALVNSGFVANVKSFDDRFMEMTQEISLAVKPVDVEIGLNKKPKFELHFGQEAMPHGPRVKLEKGRVTENPKIPHKVESLVSAGDVKAQDAVIELRKKFDEHYLTKVFSVGNLGIDGNKKIVPTRWSITAVDDILGTEMLTEVRKFAEGGHMAFFGGHLGNYYLVLCFPGCFRYELFETAVGHEINFVRDYEDHRKRTTYADATAGGYYAARLAVLERLCKMKRQISVLCLRFVTPEYWAPLGVWVVREATRNAMKSKPLIFEDEEYMMRYARILVKKKFGIDLELLLRESKLMKDMKSTLRKFF